MSAGFGPLLLLPPFLLIVGILFLRAGRRRARGRGDAPHCRACGYNLTGLPSERCPECGTELTPASIMHGRPTRSMPFMALGIIMIIEGALTLTWSLTHINWYEEQPTGMVIARLERGSDQRAWDELTRRMKLENLSDAHRSRVIDIGLKEQVATTAVPYRYELMRLFSQWLLDNKFSDAQKKTFYDQMVELKLLVRPKVIDGQDVPYGVNYLGRLPDELCAEVSQAECWIDGKRCQETPMGISLFSGMDAEDGMLASVKHWGLGQHTLEVRVKIRTHTAWILGGTGILTKGDFVHEQMISLKQNFQIVPDSAEARVRADATLANMEMVKEKVSLSELYRTLSPLPDPLDPAPEELGLLERGDLHVEILLNPDLPTAFKVFARSEGKEYFMGAIHVKSTPTERRRVYLGSTTLSITPYPRDGWHLSTTGAFPDVDYCDLILRSDVDTALHTPHLTKIWAGELLYPNVPIHHIPKQTWPPSSPSWDNE